MEDSDDSIVERAKRNYEVNAVDLSKLRVNSVTVDKNQPQATEGAKELDMLSKYVRSILAYLAWSSKIKPNPWIFVESPIPDTV